MERLWACFMQCSSRRMQRFTYTCWGWVGVLVQVWRFIKRFMKKGFELQLAPIGQCCPLRMSDTEEACSFSSATTLTNICGRARGCKRIGCKGLFVGEGQSIPDETARDSRQDHFRQTPTFPSSSILTSTVRSSSRTEHAPELPYLLRHVHQKVYSELRPPDTVPRHTQTFLHARPVSPTSVSPSDRGTGHPGPTVRDCARRMDTE